MVFLNRTQAGQKLADKLKGQKFNGETIVLAIPRGGILTGQPIARILGLPLDVLVTKKIGAPKDPELAIGAMGSIGEAVFNQDLVERFGLEKNYLQAQKELIRKEIKRREALFRKDKSDLNVAEKTVILVDDGVATGATVLAAIKILRQQNPKKIILAAPVISQEALKEVESQADEVVFLESPELFFAVGQFYKDFDQISDREALKVLNQK